MRRDVSRSSSPPARCGSSRSASSRPWLGLHRSRPEPDERSAAAGVTGIARTIGSSRSPLAAGPLYASPALCALPFFLCGGLEIAYDLLLWRASRALEPEEERATPPRA